MAGLQPGHWIKVKVHQASSGPGWHHGIVSRVETLGVKVIHFCLPEGARANDPEQQHRVISETSLAWFLEGGSDAQIVDEEPEFELAEVVRRARKYVGRAGYSLPTRNCEHFASWCYKGSAFSQQVFAFGAGAGVVSVVLGMLAIAAMSMGRSPFA